MSNNEHTPGPWRAAAGKFIRAATDDDDGALVAVVRGDYPAGTARANASLLAAAPELKQQRDELLWTLEYVQGELSEWVATPFLTEVLRVINSVIDKARKERS
jgi:hypothetical protein